MLTDSKKLRVSQNPQNRQKSLYLFYWQATRIKRLKKATTLQSVVTPVTTLKVMALGSHSDGL